MLPHPAVARINTSKCLVTARCIAMVGSRAVGTGARADPDALRHGDDGRGHGLRVAGLRRLRGPRAVSVHWKDRIGDAYARGRSPADRLRAARTRDEDGLVPETRPCSPHRVESASKGAPIQLSTSCQSFMAQTFPAGSTRFRSASASRRQLLIPEAPLADDLLWQHAIERKRLDFFGKLQIVLFEERCFWMMVPSFAEYACWTEAAARSGTVVACRARSSVPSI